MSVRPSVKSSTPSVVSSKYRSVVLNKHHVQATGRTAYRDLHGKKVSERLVEFGEVVMHYIPKKRRHKLDCRWAIGFFLGTTMFSKRVLHWLKQRHCCARTGS